MGLVTRLLGGRERRQWAPGDDRWYAAPSVETATGRKVNEETALTSTAVLACVEVLAETVASLPLITYKRLKSGGKERATDHPLYSVLHDQPNPWMTSFTFRETSTAHIALWGNAYAEIEQDNGGRVKALWPIHPRRVTVRREGSTIVYDVAMPNGPKVPLPRERVLHVRGLSLNGLTGVSRIGLAREAVGLALATEEFGARWFGNGSRPGGVLEHPGKLSKDAQDRLRSQVEEAHQGLSNAQRTMVLEEGMSWKTIGIPPDDAQFLETRKFQIEEIARIFRVPLHLVQDLSHATFSNIEHQSLDFVIHTVRPWLVRSEQEISVSLFTETERRTYFAEYLVDGLLRGDTKTRYEVYGIARQWGILSANDIRELENLNPIEGGDTYILPMNMVPMDLLGMEPPAEPTDPNPTPDEGREFRSATARRKIAKSYERVVADAAARILRREEADILREAEKQLRTRSVDFFLVWLDDFYRNHEQFATDKMRAAFLAVAEASAIDAADDIGVEMWELSSALETFTLALLAAFAQTHAAVSHRQVRATINAAVAAGVDPLPELKARFAEWSEGRAARIAQRETVRVSNAVSVETWKRNGVRRLKWRAFGKSCPYCTALNGRVVGIDQAFLEGGQPFAPNGSAPLVPRGKVGHAPAHGRCDCQVIAVTT